MPSATSATIDNTLLSIYGFDVEGTRSRMARGDRRETDGGRGPTDSNAHPDLCSHHHPRTGESRVGHAHALCHSHVLVLNTTKPVTAFFERHICPVDGFPARMLVCLLVIVILAVGIHADRPKPEEKGGSQ